MKKQILAIVMTVGTVAAFAQAKKPVTTAAKTPAKPSAATPATNILKTNTDSVSYSIGVRMAQSLRTQGFDGINLNVLQKAMGDVLANRKTLVASTSPIAF